MATNRSPDAACGASSMGALLQPRLREEPKAGAPGTAPATVVVVPDRACEAEIVAALEADLRRDLPGWSAVASCDLDVRPAYGPFRDWVQAVANRLAPADGAVLRRYAQTLVSLLPEWASHSVGRTRPYHAWLTDYVLRGNPAGLRDFYQGRNVTHRMQADIVHFLLDASLNPPEDVEGPLVLVLERLEAIGPQLLHLLRLLRRSTDGQPIALVALWNESYASDTSVLGKLADDGWAVVRSPVDSARNSCHDGLDKLGAHHRRLLSSVAVSRSAISASDIADVLGATTSAVNEAIEYLCETGWLHDSGGREMPRAPIAFAASSVELLTAHEVRTLHELARERLSVDTAPYERAYHGRQAQIDDAGRDAVRAMEQAWNVSDYTCAGWHAMHALADPAIARVLDEDVLLGLLSYEAGRYAECDRRLTRAREATSHPFRKVVFQRLIGYNGVFGLRDFEYGLRHLQTVRDYFDVSGQPRDVAWVQNAMAFALVNLGREADAVELEAHSLKIARDLPEPDAFLLTILQLNLGRLHRKGSLVKAREFIRRSIAASRGETTPYLLLLFHVTLGSLDRAHGDMPAALREFHRCLDITTDMDLGAFSDRVFPIVARTYAKTVGPLDDALALRGDIGRILIHFMIALIYAELGYPDRVEPYRRWLTDQLARLGLSHHVRPLREALSRAGARVRPRSGPAAVAFDAQVESALEDHRDALRYERVQGVEERVAEMVAQSSAVAVILPREMGVTDILDSLVLFDPRSGELRARVGRQLGRSYPAGGILALSDAAEWFTGATPLYQWVVQETDLRPQHRSSLGGVVPIRTRVRFLPEKGSGGIGAVVRSFADRTGIPFLSAMSFRLAGEEIAEHAPHAIKNFLETSLDHLVIGAYLVSKRHGRSAAANLARLKPRLSNHVRIAHRAPGGGAQIVLSRSCLRVGWTGSAVLERCNGRTPAAELVADLANTTAEAEEAYRFLRRLRLRGVVHFAR